MVTSRLPVFTQRFIELRGEQTQAQFAAMLGFSRPTVALYESGDRIPDSVALKVIAEKCNVSADYLLGLTDIRTSNQDIRYICEYTGLTAEAVDELHTVSIYAKKNPDDYKIHNFSEFVRDNYHEFVRRLSDLNDAIDLLYECFDYESEEEREECLNIYFDEAVKELYLFSELCRRIPNKLFDSEMVIEGAEKALDRIVRESLNKSQENNAVEETIPF